MNLQSEYSLLDRSAEKAILPECDRLGLSFVPYFPLAGGMLTGKYRRGDPLPIGSRLAEMPTWPAGRERFYNERNLTVLDNLEAYLQEHGHNVLDAAFSFLLAKPALASVIAGATTPLQVRANVAAAERPLTGNELAALDVMTIGRDLATDRPETGRPGA